MFWFQNNAGSCTLNINSQMVWAADSCVTVLYSETRIVYGLVFVTGGKGGSRTLPIHYFLFPRTVLFKMACFPRSYFPPKRKALLLISALQCGEQFVDHQLAAMRTCSVRNQGSVQGKTAMQSLSLCTFFLSEIKISHFQSSLTVCNYIFSIPKSTLRKSFYFCTVSGIPFQLLFIPNNPPPTGTWLRQNFLASLMVLEHMGFSLADSQILTYLLSMTSSAE